MQCKLQAMLTSKAMQANANSYADCKTTGYACKLLAMHMASNAMLTC
jgi:hypothetical protein